MCVIVPMTDNEIIIKIRIYLRNIPRNDVTHRLSTNRRSVSGQ